MAFFFRIPMNYAAFLMYGVTEMLGDVFRYGFFEWDCQAKKGIGKKSTDYSPKKTSEKDKTEEENKSEDDVEVAEALVTDKADVMSVKNCTVGNACVSNKNDYQ